MNDIDLDRETTQAVEDLAYRLRDREPGTDPEVFALEYITALRGRGWRPTEARRMAAARSDGDSPQPAPDKPGGAQYLEHRRKVEELAAQAAERRRAGAA